MYYFSTSTGTGHKIAGFATEEEGGVLGGEIRYDVVSTITKWFGKGRRRSGARTRVTHTHTHRVEGGVPGDFPFKAQVPPKLS